MKECPICGSRCFDDMDRCYGCLHDFTRDEAGAVESGVDGSGAGNGEEARVLRRSASRQVSHAPSDPGWPEGDARAVTCRARPIVVEPRFRFGRAFVRREDLAQPHGFLSISGRAVWNKYP